MRRISKDEALEYHAREPRGKVRVVPTKPTATQRDLSLAYTPGVAHPCEEIRDDPMRGWDYTARG
jgi:malate dehydrogenase (oxaloacetate-decarboxylating)(NADP+)